MKTCIILFLILFVYALPDLLVWLGDGLSLYTLVMVYGGLTFLSVMTIGYTITLTLFAKLWN